MSSPDGSLLPVFPVKFKKPIEINVGEGSVVKERIEIGACFEPERIGSEPSAEGGHVIPSAVVHEPRFGIESFRGKAPGIGSGRRIFFSEGAIGVLLARVIYKGDDLGNVALEVVYRNVEFLLKLKSNGCSYFGMGSSPENAQLSDSALLIRRADFVVSIIQIVNCFGSICFGDSAVLAVIGKEELGGAIFESG